MSTTRNPSKNITLSIYLSVFSLAVTVRLVNLWFIEDFSLHALVEDSAIYWNGVKYWLDSGFFSELSPSGAEYTHNTERVPLYFIFLIPFQAFMGDTLFPPIVAQVFLDAASCVIIAKLGSLISFRTGVISGFSSAVWYNLILHTSFILTETVFLFLMCLLLLVSAYFLLDCKLRHAALLGVICGLAMMTRTLVVLLPLIIALTCPVVTKYRLGNWRHGVSSGILVIVCSLLPASPIIYRNLTHFHTPHLTSQNGVFVLNWAVGLSKSLESGRSFDEESYELNQKLERRIKNLPGQGEGLSPFEVSSQRLLLAKEEMSAMAVSTLLQGWLYGAVNNLASPVIAVDPRIRKFNTKSFYNTPGNNILEKTVNFLEGNNPFFVTMIVLSIIGGLIFCSLQFAGWVLLLRSHFWVAVIGGLYVLYFLVVSGPVGSAKYRLPIEPLLIIFQSYWISVLHKKYFQVTQEK